MYEGKNVHFSVVDSKPLCSYSQKVCKLRRLTGYAFCVRHILEDPTAPFKQCEYMVKSTGQKCTSAIHTRQDRIYCHSHMQCMGMAPKKERKSKKVQAIKWDDESIPPQQSEESMENTSYLEQFHSLSNGTQELHKPAQFSASKMFPELAGKLSSDGHTTEGSVVLTDDTHCSDSQENNLHKTVAKTKLSSPKRPAKPAHSKTDNHKNGLVNGLTSSVTSSWFESSSPTKSSHGPASKRSKKSTRKNLSIMRKKQTGLLSEQEARENLTAQCYKSYSQYAVRKSYCADILTHPVDSSDDESTVTFVRSQTLDLNSKHSISESSSKSEREKASNGSLLDLKKQSLQISQSLSINEEAAEYKKEYFTNLIKCVKDNLKCAAYMLRQMNGTNTRKEQTSGTTPHTYRNTKVVRSGKRKVCMYKDEECKQCTQSCLPLANHCMKHIMYSVEQQLFEFCTYNGEDEGGAQCCHPVIDNWHESPLCAQHGYYEIDKPSDATDVPSKKHRKKPKPLALLRPSKKKKKKSIAPQKPVPPLRPFYQVGAVSNSTNHRVEESVGAKADDNIKDFEDSELISPLDKSLELEVDSKILDDNEIQQVLNNDEFDLFSVKNDFPSGLTEEDADLILAADDVTDNVEEEESELPAHITDTILHVESEQRNRKALQLQQNILHHHPNSYNAMHGIETSYNDASADFTQYGHRPPPEYPGNGKVMSGPMPPHTAPMDFLPASPQSYRLAGIAKLQEYSMMHRGRVSLPPLLDSQHSLNSSGGSTGGRLPPVSTITMQPWQEQHHHYPQQNGYHHPQHHHRQMTTDHFGYNNMYHQNGTASPPPPLYQQQQQARRPSHSQLYASRQYSNGPTAPTYHMTAHHPTAHQQPPVDSPL